MLSQPIPSRPSVPLPHSRHRRHEPQGPRHRDPIPATVQIRLEFLDRMDGGFLGLLRLILRDQDVPEVPVSPRDTQRIIRLIRRPDRTISSQQRQIRPPDPLRKRPQREIHVRRQPGRFAPFLTLTEGLEGPRRRLDVRQQRRENLGPLREPPRRRLPNLPSSINPLPQPSEVDILTTPRSTKRHHPTIQLRCHRMNTAVPLKLRFSQQNPTPAHPKSGRTCATAR